MKKFIVVGGGPAAAREAAILSSFCQEVTIISEQFGACMDIMGEQSLQSYCNELTLPNTKIRLEECIKCPAISPTGLEYQQYVTQYIDALPVKKVSGSVSFFSKEHGQFYCNVSTLGETQRYYCDELVLATGSFSRTAPPVFSAMKPINCFKAYEMFQTDDPSLCFYCKIAILGSGNTAFQLAKLAVERKLDTVILAKSYIGIYPQETQNKFALRAPSQLTIEYIWKSQTGENITPLAFLCIFLFNLR